MSNDHDLFGGLCRFCGLRKSSSKYIFSSEAMKIGLLTKIKHLFPEEADLINCDTVLPKFICDTCETTVNYFHEFRNGVKLVQQNLQKKLQDDISKECNEIGVAKARHVCSASKKTDVLNIRFGSDGFVSCLSCDAELRRDEILSPCDGKAPLCVCDECGFKDKVDMFISKEDLSSGCPKCAYMKEKPLSPPKGRTYECDACAKSFRSRGHLNRHLLTHYGSKPFACAECGSRFSQKSSLKTHALIHDRANPFACTWCGQRFRHKQTLANHVVGIHGVASGSPRVYECDKCRKRFVQKEKLERHYRSHSGEKPYECDLCERTFAQKVNLKTHRKKHESEAPFSAPCPTQMPSDTGVANRPAVQAVADPLDGDRFAELTRHVEAKREHDYSGLASSALHPKRDANFAPISHSVLNDADKGELIHELLRFESMSAANDSLETFPSIGHGHYRADGSALKVSGDANAIYFDPPASDYIMYSSDSSLYDLENVSQCSALPTFSSLNQVP